MFSRAVASADTAAAAQYAAVLLSAGGPRVGSGTPLWARGREVGERRARQVVLPLAQLAALQPIRVDASGQGRLGYIMQGGSQARSLCRQVHAQARRGRRRRGAHGPAVRKESVAVMCSASALVGWCGTLFTDARTV